MVLDICWQMAWVCALMFENVEFLLYAVGRDFTSSIGYVTLNVNAAV